MIEEPEWKVMMILFVTFIYRIYPWKFRWELTVKTQISATCATLKFFFTQLSRFQGSQVSYICQLNWPVVCRRRWIFSHVWHLLWMFLAHFDWTWLVWTFHSCINWEAEALGGKIKFNHTIMWNHQVRASSSLGLLFDI